MCGRGAPTSQSRGGRRRKVPFQEPNQLGVDTTQQTRSQSVSEPLPTGSDGVWAQSLTFRQQTVVIFHSPLLCFYRAAKGEIVSRRWEL